MRDSFEALGLAIRLTFAVLTVAWLVSAPTDPGAWITLAAIVIAFILGGSGQFVSGDGHAPFKLEVADDEARPSRRLARQSWVLVGVGLVWIAVALLVVRVALGASMWVTVGFIWAAIPIVAIAGVMMSRRKH